MIEAVYLSELYTDQRLKCRDLNLELVNEYAKIVAAGKLFDGAIPRVVHNLETDEYYLVDGWHRLFAHFIVGIPTMNCEVTSGTFDDALRLACGANATHGRPRSDADKRRAILICLANSPADISTRHVAEICRVSRGFADTVRTEWERSKGRTRPTTVRSKNGQQQPSTRRHTKATGQRQPYAYEKAHG